MKLEYTKQGHRWFMWKTDLTNTAVMFKIFEQTLEAKVSKKIRRTEEADSCRQYSQLWKTVQYLLSGCKKLEKTVR